MKAKVIYSPSNNAKEAYEEIKRKIDELDFKPNFLFLFLTARTWKAYKSFNELLKRRFPETKMLGCIVEGYIADDEIWMRGVAVLLAEFDGDVEVFWAKEKTATKTIEKLGDKIGRGWDAVLVMFPAFYFPGKFEFLKAFLNDKRYYSKYSKKRSVEEKKKVLKDYSKYLESKFVFPINKTLKILSRKTGEKTPIIGMNLVPLEGAAHTPLILANYKDIGRAAAIMCFKGEINAIFHDIFPERGESYEETVEVIKSFFSNVEEVEVIKDGVVIGEINGMKPVEFLKMKMSGFKDVSEDEFLKRVESGRVLMASPYGLVFISKQTYGGPHHGLINYPVNLYPSLFEFNEFYDTAIFCGEIFRGGIKSFGRIFDKKKFNGLDFFIVDHNAIMSFSGDVYKLVDMIKEKSYRCFGVFSSYPSAYIPNINTKFLSDVGGGICINLTGTTAILEFT